MSALQGRDGPPLVFLDGIDKSFGGRKVLEAVDFDLRAGEVHALLGENGAGKSTLMNVLAGLYAADAGRVVLDGRPLAIRSPADASAAGIGMVHQHFRLVPVFTAAENLVLAGGGRNGLRNPREATATIDGLVARTGLDVHPGRRVADLSVAERQRVEILKVLALGSRILILDEPTAVLTDDEAARLLAVVRDLAAGGLGIVLITHKMREVAAAGDRVSVMRAGRMVLAGAPAAGADARSLARAMVGDQADAPAAARPPLPAGHRPERLIVSDLATRGADGSVPLDGIALTLHAGEILGVAGVGGNGQAGLVRVLTGLESPARGSVSLDGEDLAEASVARRRDRGLRVIPSDRSESALVGDLPVAENLALGDLRRGAFGRLLVSRGAMAAAARRAIDAFAIAGATPGRVVRLLSGGNAQKVVLARELDDGARVIVAHSPTRGLDVGACRFVHERLAAAARRGAGVLLISEDLEEILALSHRVLVMSRGRIAGDCGSDPSREAVGRLMLGHA